MAQKPEAPAELKEDQLEKVTLSGRTEERESRIQVQTHTEKTILHLRIILKIHLKGSFNYINICSYK